MPTFVPMTGAQVQGLLWVVRHPVHLDAGLRFVANPALRADDEAFQALANERPSDRTLGSLLSRGWVAPTPGRPAGPTAEGRRLALLHLYPGGNAQPIPYYLPASSIRPGALVDLQGDPVADPDPDVPTIYESELARVLDPANDPSIMPPTQSGYVSLWIATGHEDTVIPFPEKHLLRQVGVSTDDRDTVWDGA